LVRSAASSVSTLSSVVANGCQTMQPVSSSPSKIPVGGFFPVRLQTGSPRRPSPGPTGQRLYAVPVLPSNPVAIAGMSRGSSVTTRSRPEALGSPAGYVVPPGHRELGPHPSLWPPPADLCLNTAGLRGPITCHWETSGSPLFSACLYPRAAFRTPMDCAIALDCFFTAPTSLRQFRCGSASISPREPVDRGRRNEAAKFALCYGPLGLLALPRPGLLLSSFHLRRIAPRKRRV